MVDTDERVQAAPGQVNDVSATLEDAAGNAVDETTETYVRKCDAVEDPAVRIDAVYVPWMGDWIADHVAFDEDFSAYSTDPGRHIDQMGYDGIAGMLFQYSDRQQRNAFERLSELETFSNIELHPYFNGIKWYERNARRRGTEFEDLLDDTLEYVRDNMLRLGNNARIDGRPMITFWDVDFVAWAGNERASRTKEAILDTWGDWGRFVEHLRDTLTVDTRPFLVADVHNNAIHGRYDDLNRHFDGVTNWVGQLQTNEVTSWDDSYESQRRSFEAIREFVAEHGMEFIPTVHPGFYNRHNPNLDDWNRLPRDPSRLGDVLASANEFRTVDRIYVATFNGIREGHRVCPSVFRGKDRGTAYLEEIREFQKGSET